MGEFVVSVVVDVLGHVFIKDRKGSCVRCVAASAGDFASVWNATQFVVLDPEVGFENFCGSREPKQGRVTAIEPTTPLFPALFGKDGAWVGEKPSAQSCCSRSH